MVWRGVEINVKKTFLLIIDEDQKRRESMPEGKACRHQI